MTKGIRLGSKNDQHKTSRKFKENPKLLVRRNPTVRSANKFFIEKRKFLMKAE